MPGQADDIGVHGAFDAVEHGAHPHAVERVRPRVPRSKRDSIVITVREAEPEQEPSAGVRAERRKDLVAQRAHSGRADHDHALVVKADLTLVTPELDEVSQLKVVVRCHSAPGGGVDARAGGRFAGAIIPPPV